LRPQPDAEAGAIQTSWACCVSRYSRSAQIVPSRNSSRKWYFLGVEARGRHAVSLARDEPRRVVAQAGERAVEVARAEPREKRRHAGMLTGEQRIAIGIDHHDGAEARGLLLGGRIGGSSPPVIL